MAVLGCPIRNRQRLSNSISNNLAVIICHLRYSAVIFDIKAVNNGSMCQEFEIHALTAVNHSMIQMFLHAQKIAYL